VRTILHILTRPADNLANDLISQQRSLPQTAVEVMELTDPVVNYDALVEKIFNADSVEVW
jgi:hypothetical protein